MTKKEQMFGIFVSFMVFLFIAFIVLFPFVTVGTGKRAVIMQFGEVQDRVLSEGFHLISPIQNTVKYDVRTQKIDVNADSASKDLQSVTATITINYRINDFLVGDLHKQTSGRYEDVLIAPAIQESIKSATAQFTADELITKRQEVKNSMKEALITRENMRYFIIEDVSITNFSFSESFNVAIENKVRAEQDALASKNKLEQTKYEAEQKIVSAEAEAMSLKIQAEALANNQSLVELEAVRRWNGVLPSYVMGGSIPFINLK